MKKRFLALTLTILLFGIATCLITAKYAKNQHTSINPTSSVSTSEETSIPNGADVRPELRTAVKTIYEKYPDIKIGEDFKVTGYIEHVAMMGPDGYSVSVCTVKEVSDKNVKFLFLTEDDTKVVMGTETEVNFVEELEEYKKEQYHNSDNFNENAFAFQFKGDSSVILTEPLSSVWTFDPSTKEISIFEIE